MGFFLITSTPPSPHKGATNPDGVLSFAWFLIDGGKEGGAKTKRGKESSLKLHQA